MENEFEVTTPVTTVENDTSTTVEPSENGTSTEVEPTTDDTAVQNSEGGEPELYAGKYKTVEELVKGYKNAESYIAKANDYEKKANDLEKRVNELINSRNEEIQKQTNQKLAEAQSRGFKSVEEQEIADKVQVAEFEQYCNNLQYIDPEHAQIVQKCLQDYYHTAHPSYLEEAKRYFPAEFIERVAIAKNNLQAKLQNELKTQQQQKYALEQHELAQSIKQEFPEFIGDLEQNKGKAQALQSFSEAGFINSIEDMKAFEQVYNSIAQYERDLYAKELKAKTIIDETKNKAVISSTPVGVTPQNSEAPTLEQIVKMTQEEYNAAVDKYGLNTILNAK